MRPKRRWRCNRHMASSLAMSIRPFFEQICPHLRALLWVGPRYWCPQRRRRSGRGLVRGGNSGGRRRRRWDPLKDFPVGGKDFLVGGLSHIDLVHHLVLIGG